MNLCSKCGSVLSEGDKLCPNCGAEVVPTEKKLELVEKLSFEHFIITERGITFRVRNIGTASLTVARIVFDRQPAEIVGVSAEKRTVEGGRLTLQPGDVGEVTFSPSYFDARDLGYPAAVITESGKRYETTVVYS